MILMLTSNYWYVYITLRYQKYTVLLNKTFPRYLIYFILEIVIRTFGTVFCCANRSLFSQFAASFHRVIIHGVAFHFSYVRLMLVTLTSMVYLCLKISKPKILI